MALRMTDFNGHEVPDLNGAALTVGALGTSAVGTISPNANAGTTATVAAVSGVASNDRRGTFAVVSAGTGQTAGIVASVRYAQPYSAIPGCINIQVTNITGTTASSAATTNVTVAGFDVVSTVLTTTNSYNVSYSVIA